MAALLSIGLLVPLALLQIKLSKLSQPTIANELSHTDIPANAQHKTKFISDEELFSLFPGKSIALIGKPGEQQLVFLQSADSSEVQ